MSTTDLQARRQHNLQRLLRPRSVALVGGRTLIPAIDVLRRAGFTGAVHVVNPQQTEIGGIPCVSSIAELPEAPDATFLSVNRHLTVEAVRALAERGAGGAICFAAGFGEMGGLGVTLEQELIAAARDLALVGPNSNGLMNRLDGLALWPTDAPNIERLDAGVAIIAQSGGVASMLLRDRRGLRPAVVVSTGNQTLLGPADWLQVLSQDVRVTAVGLFVEGLGDVNALSVAAQAAQARGLPVVALKSGRSALGAQMAATHTGSLAGDDALFDTLCERLGFVRARSLPQLTETLKAMGAWGTLKGRRSVVVTVSGAARTLFADAAAVVGLEFPPPSAAMALALRPQLPEFAHVSNPLDFNAAYTGLTGLTLENEPALLDCFRTVLSDRYDVAVLHSDWTEFGPQGSPTFRAWIQATREAGTPAALVSMMPENMSTQAQDICRANGLACLQGLDDAVAAIAAVAAHGERQAARTSADAMLLPGPVAAGLNPRVLDEWDSKTQLAAAGIAFPPARCVAADVVLQAGHGIGFPVVLKAVSTALPHKHQAGAVALSLADGVALQSALDHMAATLVLARITPDAYLVEKMVTGSVAELIIGIKADPVYGQALVIGAGGVETERLNDIQTVLLPATDVELLRALARLHVAAALPAPVRQAIVVLAQATARYAQENRANLLALDLNPVIVTDAGQVIAVDALLHWQDAP